MGVEVAERKLVGGRYTLESLLGAGGMGEVWRARHVALNSQVAIKFLAGTSAQKPSTRKRFLTEAQVTAQLKTRHAVQVFDFGITDEGQPYLVMEMLDGETLGHRLARVKRLPIDSTVRFLEQAARALDRAHALGIVHRDFKPDNIVIILDEEGRESVKVLDFGIAKLLNELDAPDVEEAEPFEATKAFATFTRTGTVLGTPLYMAPEQVRNSADLDLRADIWAFGVVAYQCVTGIPPFEGKSLLDLFERIAAADHPLARSVNRDLPQAFDDWFNIACAPDPNKRFSSAKMAATQLAIALEGGALVSGSLRMSDSGSGRDVNRSSFSAEPTTSPSANDSGPAKSLPPDALSRTLEAPSSPSRPAGRVKTSDRPPPGSDQGSQIRFGRIPSAPPPAQTTTSQSPSDHAVTRPSMRLNRGRKRVALWAVLVAAPLVALATYKAGLLVPTPSQTSAPIATPSAPASAPPTATAITAPSATVAAAANDAGATPATSASTTPLAARPIQSGLRPFVIAPATNTSTAPAPTATAAPTTPPPTPPPTPPAASGASPFKLPPLGI